MVFDGAFIARAFFSTLIAETNKNNSPNFSEENAEKKNNSV